MGWRPLWWVWQGLNLRPLRCQFGKRERRYAVSSTAWPERLHVVPRIRPAAPSKTPRQRPPPARRRDGQDRHTGRSWNAERRSALAGTPARGARRRRPARSAKPRSLPHPGPGSGRRSTWRHANPDESTGRSHLARSARRSQRWYSGCERVWNRGAPRQHVASTPDYGASPLSRVANPPLPVMRLASLREEQERGCDLVRVYDPRRLFLPGPGRTKLPAGQAGGRADVGRRRSRTLSPLPGNIGPCGSKLRLSHRRPEAPAGSRCRFRSRT